MLHRSYFSLFHTRQSRKYLTDYLTIVDCSLLLNPPIYQLYARMTLLEWEFLRNRLGHNNIVLNGLFVLLLFGAVMLATVSRCTTLCHTILNCILLCCQVFIKQWHFDFIKGYFFAEGHCPSHSSVFRQRNTNFASLPLRWCIHFAVTAVLNLSPVPLVSYSYPFLPLVSATSIFPIVELLSCENDVIWI